MTQFKRSRRQLQLLMNSIKDDSTKRINTLTESVRKIVQALGLSTDLLPTDHAKADKHPLSQRLNDSFGDDLKLPNLKATG
jgi:hypothetical protein